MHFDSIRAFSVKPGDKMPAPLSWGGWDRSKALCVTATRDEDNIMIISLENGQEFRVIPMNRVPFIKR